MLLDFTHCAAQSRAYHALAPGNRVCNAWGRGVGKSWFARVNMYLDVAKWDHRVRHTLRGPLRGIRQVLLMPTLKQFKKVHQVDLERELGPGGQFGALGGKINHSDWRIRFPGGSWIQVVSAVNINESRGIRCDKLVVDESDDIAIGDYTSVCVPWFSEPFSLDIRLVTGTPRRGRYGLLWKAFSVWPDGDAETPAVPKHYGFHATYKDAPAIVSAEKVAEARRTTTPDTFAREWECDFDSGEGLVYSLFDVKFHVRRPPGMHLFREFLVGFDYGFNDPSVFLIIGVAGHGRDTICHVVREHYVTCRADTELAAIAAGIELAFPHARWFSDHHPSTIQAFREIAKVDVALADKTYKVEDGVAFVTDTLFVHEDEEERRWAQLYIDPSCKHTIEEFGLYRRKRDPRNADRVLDDIDTSDNDHCMDALRYALVTRFAGLDRRLVLG